MDQFHLLPFVYALPYGVFDKAKQHQEADYMTHGVHTIKLSHKQNMEA
jgi:hypothetical protein